MIPRRRRAQNRRLSASVLPWASHEASAPGDPLPRSLLNCLFRKFLDCAFSVAASATKRVKCGKWISEPILAAAPSTLPLFCLQSPAFLSPTPGGQQPLSHSPTLVPPGRSTQVWPGRLALRSWGRGQTPGGGVKLPGAGPCSWGRGHTPGVGARPVVGSGALTCSRLPAQRPVPDQGDRRGPAVPGEQSAGPRAEPHRVLPDEHPRAAARHLPVPARRERAQPPRQDRRGLGPVQQGQEGRRGTEGRGCVRPRARVSACPCVSVCVDAEGLRAVGRGWGGSTPFERH